MTEKILESLKTEELLLDEVIAISEKQQRVLVEWNLNELQGITAKLEDAARELNYATAERVALVAEMLHIDEDEARKLKLSDYEDILELGKNSGAMREMFKGKTRKLYSINAVNRMLANRASHSVKDMMSIMSNGRRKVCNVKV